MITAFRDEHAFLSNFYDEQPFLARWYGDLFPYPSTEPDFDHRPGAELNKGEELALWEWKSVEHYFQAAKTTDRDRAKLIKRAGTPQIAKRMGREVELRHDWEVVKFDVMLRALRHKFSDRELAQRLLATGDQKLVEGNTWGDKTWGCVFTHTNGVGQPSAGEWRGENWLGRLLALVRAECRARVECARGEIVPSGYITGPVQRLPDGWTWFDQEQGLIQKK